MSTQIDTAQIFAPPAKKEKDPMEAYRQKLNPNVKLTPEQLLLKTLKLMHETKSVDELTPERLEEIYGVSVKKLSETRLYGLLEDISDSWWQEFSIVKSLSSKYFSIEFNHDPNISVNTFPECNITFEDFLSRAEKLGFTVQHQLRYGAVYEFTRLNNGYLHVQVVPLRREVGDEPREGELNCIGMINLY
ncbi:hypothetical protein [Kingella oralis]|uniref:hypothetical protein n=1 Tax=Kingella oralis TaxID=505 RepID=UPI0034E43581